MFNFFDLNTIPNFLSRFKVEKVLLIGLPSEPIMNEIIPFCINHDSLLYAIDSKIDINEIIKKNFNLDDAHKYLVENVMWFKDFGLKILPSLKSFDAIFINDEPNWYTIYTELNLIKKNNSDFPLVFVCNNRYPHKRRDSYMNPKYIPEEYRQECYNDLPITYEENNEIKNILIKDKFCHAINENTPKNGVLTAIEDFLDENKNLKLLEINPLEGISLIYKDSTISYIRINKILEKETESKFTPGDLSDKLIENNLLLKHATEINLHKHDLNKMKDIKSEIERKNVQINDYENKIKACNSIIENKNSHINEIGRQINLKETQIQSLETKLMSKDYEIKSKESELEYTQNKLNEIEKNFSNNEKELEKVKKELFKVNNRYKNHDLIENKYKELIELDNKRIKTNKDFINSREHKFNELKSEYIKQSNKLNNNEYHIKCYKEKISNNNVEIAYLKKSDKISKKLFNPLSYVFIILKSKPKEIKINFKLFKALKNSNCFDIGYYLNKYPDIANSKWCKYFSPELHYVCEGFNENRRINRRHINNKNKKELIKDIKK